MASISFGIPYLDFDVSINNNPYPEDIFIHSTTPGNEHMFMAILDSTLQVKWYIVSTDGNEINIWNIRSGCVVQN